MNTNLVGWRANMPSLWGEDDTSMSSTFGNLLSGFDYFFGDATYTDDEGNVVYEIEVPGFNKDNLSISLDNGMLTVSGKREVITKSHAGLKQISKRLSMGDIEDADAKIIDGILYITIKSKTKNKKEIKLT